MTIDMPTAVRKFTKRPVEIEAVQIRSGGDIQRAINWIKHHGGDAAGTDTYILITTLEGVMEGPLGCWIIRGVKGEFYPCDAEIFAATYDEVV
jgi:hypothetical protein